MSRRNGPQRGTSLHLVKRAETTNHPKLRFGTSTWFTDVGFNEPMSTSQFTFIGQADEATTPTVADNRDPTQVADPRLEALIEARSNEIPGESNVSKSTVQQLLNVVVLKWLEEKTRLLRQKN